ncbi:SoxR reducing system RseC family protein [Niveibacterium umoris]|nr:SoxR reducing system RseC family protein [Niveibacterium umoris]
MMERTARVIAIHPGHMDVAVQPAAACSACGARKACQGESADRVFALPLAPGVVLGAEVSLALEDHRLLMTAALAYLVPAVGCVVGAVLGQILGHGNLTALAGALTGLFAGLLPARVLTARLGDDWNQPAIHSCSPLPPSDKRSSES